MGLRRARPNEKHLPMKVKWDGENVAPLANAVRSIERIIKQSLYNFWTTLVMKVQLKLKRFAKVRDNIPHLDMLVAQRIEFKFVQFYQEKRSQ